MRGWSRATGALVWWALVLLAVGVVNALVGIGRHRTMTKIRMDASFRSVRATVGTRPGWVLRWLVASARGRW